jgi:hypothetical protein
VQPSPLAIVGLIAGIEESYFDSERATAWAIHQLERCTAAGWLSDLVCCGGQNDALEALRHGSQSLDMFTKEIDYISLRFGFGFLVYKSGCRDLAALLQQSGEVADACGHGNPDCEAFYLLLNEIDGGGPTMPSEIPLVLRVEELYAPHARLARQAEMQILSAAQGSS